MAALTADRASVLKEAYKRRVLVAAGAKLFTGAIAMKNAAGFAVQGQTALGLRMLGTVVSEDADNTLGADGDLYVEVVSAADAWDTANAGADQVLAKHVGQMGYVVDDHTIAPNDGGGTRSQAGLIFNVTADGVFILPGAAPSRTTLTRRIDTLKASVAGVYRVLSGVFGQIVGVRCVIDGALVTADATITTTINGVPVTAGVVDVVQAASAAGTKASATPTGANTVVPGDTIELTVGGGATTDIVGTVTIEIDT